MLRRGRVLVSVLVLLALALMTGGGLIRLYVDGLWFHAVGFEGVFWTRIAWLWGARLIVGVLVAGAVFLNLRYASRTLGGIQIKRRFANLEIAERLPRSYVLWGIGAVSAVLGLWFAASIPPGVGESVLFAFQSRPWGVAEPVLGHDASFYALVYPVLENASTLLLVIAFLVFTACSAGYAATGSLRWGGRGVVMGHQPRIHLGFLAAVFILFLAVRLWLTRYGLLLNGTSAVEGIFGFADDHARLPAFRVLSLLAAASAAMVFYGAWRNRLVPALVGVAVVVVGSLVGVRLYPSLVQRFRVGPNELEWETPYIENNLAYTRTGFGLDVLEEELFPYDSASVPTASEALAQVDDLPVWTENTLLTTFRELEARFPYYDFEGVDIDRYPTPAGPRVVAVSVREIEPSGIQVQDWQNLHIRERYLAGMGAVASAATQRTPLGRPPMYLWAIPPEFSGGADAPRGLRLTRPSTYVGTRQQHYAVITPTSTAFLAADSTPGRAGEDFPEGISLASSARKLALAWYHRDWTLLFADEVTDSSRFVMRRQVLERVASIAPFLVYPEEPYPVVLEGRIVWVLEGFTATAAFPLSTRHRLPDGRAASYARNSVKVVVDAHSGEVRFYRLPEPDPLLDTYARAFPDLLLSLDEMPAELRGHLRYSRALIDIQADVLARYHQDSAPLFHRQQDVWTRPQELARGDASVSYEPEFGLYRLPGDESEAFHLTAVFVPEGRQNLTGILAGSLDNDGRRALRLLNVPVADQAPGPRQVEALVEQDPSISQQLSLWRTGGSQVWTGHLHLVPAGRGLLYMEPIFLAAEADAIPELRRFVVSDGHRVVMEETLSEAIAVLTGEEVPETVELVVAEVEETEAPSPVSSGDALDLLDLAEDRLRAGDWEGFGGALEALRDLLERATQNGDGEP
jgi:uncharacterized membrane protein (UPF0182 family)